MKVGRSLGQTRSPRRARGPAAAAQQRVRNHTTLGGLSLLVVAFCIYLLTGPFTFTLTAQNPMVLQTVDASTMRYEGNSQVLLYAVRFGVLAVAGIYGLSRWRRLFADWRRLLPIAPFVVWAMLSVFWSDDPGVSFRNVASLAALVIAAYCFHVALAARDMALAALLAGVVTAVFSLIYITFMPSYGVHQISDATQAVHAGAWRGVYLHKNFLGHVMAAFAAAMVWADTSTFRSTPLKWGLTVLFLAIMLLTTSASALFIPPITILLTWFLVAVSIKARLRTSIVLVPALLLSALTIPMLLELIGRDESLTGRDQVWRIALESIGERPIHGFGYMSISFGDFGYRLLSATGLIDPHSGYFDTLLGTGLVGLILLSLPVFAAFRSARQLYMQGGGDRQASLIFVSLLIAWLISCVTEANDRPLTPMGGLGIFAMSALLALSDRQRAAAARLTGQRENEDPAKPVQTG